MKRTALLMCVLLAALPCAGGVVYEIEVKDHEQGVPKSESIQAAVEGRHLKMGIASGGKGEKGEMIFRGDRREMVVVDHKKKTYTVFDEATAKQIAGQVSQAEAMMAEALKNVPEDKRAMVEQMMKQKMPHGQTAPPQRSKSELKKTGEKATHNGYPCVKYEVLRDGRKIRELWVTDWSNVEGGAEVVDVFEDMADFFQEMLDSLPSFAGSRDMADPAFEHMKEIGGFPVVTKEFADDGSLEGETTLRSARRQTLDPDAFEPPSGYKRQEMFGGR